MVHAAARLTGTFLLAVGVLACQPADDPDLDADAEAQGADAATDPVGAPEQSLPQDLGTLLDGLESTATEWQAEPVVAEIVVEVEGEAWSSAAVTYLAPDADRFLLLRVSPEGTRQERPTLEGFELQPVTAEGTEQIPGTDGLLDPAALVAAAHDTLEECAVGDPSSVVYATGAPAVWDGDRWTEPPAWSATVSGEGAAAVDPATGAPAGGDPCVAD